LPRGVELIVKPSRTQLVEIRNLVEAGHLSPVVENTLLLKNRREALERSSGGHNVGKLVLRAAHRAAGR
jgi:NADPH:quinone reductase-like Zn-dependent oxidoreductase